MLNRFMKELAKSYFVCLNNSYYSFHVTFYLMDSHLHICTCPLPVPAGSDLQQLFEYLPEI